MSLRHIVDRTILVVLGVVSFVLPGKVAAQKRFRGDLYYANHFASEKAAVVGASTADVGSAWVLGVDVQVKIIAHTQLALSFEHLFDRPMVVHDCSKNNTCSTTSYNSDFWGGALDVGLRPGKGTLRPLQILAGIATQYQTVFRIFDCVCRDSQSCPT